MIDCNVNFATKPEAKAVVHSMSLVTCGNSVIVIKDFAEHGNCLIFAQLITVFKKYITISRCTPYI